MSRRVPSFEAVLIVVLAAGCGVSPLFYGYYNLRAWGPIGLGLLAVVFALVVARPAVVPRPAWAATSALGGLAVWALVSRWWSGSPANALTEANRWAVYTALLVIFVLLLRDERSGRLFITVAAALVLALAGYVLIRMLGGGGDLFLVKRLNKPLGYVNGQATYFLIGIWPLVAVGERVRRPWLAGAAVGGATVLAGLVLLSETRAVVPAIVVSAVVLMAVVPGRLRRAWILVVVTAAIAAVSGPLLGVYGAASASAAPSTVRHAATAVVLAGLAAGVAWTIACALASRADAAFGARARRASAAVLVLLVLIGVLAVGARGDDPVHALSRQISAFTQLRSTKEQKSRFLSGGGTRYDYWRIALHELRDHPVRGVGAGGYQFDYFRERQTAEDIRQPHSIELQALAELGLVGGVLVAVFIASVLVGFVRRTSISRCSPAEAGLTVAAGGIFLVWLVHTSVDWIHLIPGVTGTALGAAAVLLARSRGVVPAPARGRLHAVAVAVTGLLVLVTVLFVGRATLADHYATAAENALPAAPRRALADADRSLALNSDSVPAHHLRAAARARLHDYAGARGALLDAIRVEPDNFVTWVLLGDLAVRHGDLGRSRVYYRTALRLNPRDAELRQLARPTPR